MRSIPGVGYVEDGGDGHAEPTSSDDMNELDTPAERIAEAIRGLSGQDVVRAIDEQLKAMRGDEGEMPNQRTMIADIVRAIIPTLLQAPNLRLSAYGLSFALDVAAINGISMEDAGRLCGKGDGALKSIDNLSHEHHIIAGFLDQSEKAKWLEIARAENLTADEFRASLQQGVVIRLHGVTRAAISKYKREWQRRLGIRQSRAGKSEAACKAYRKAQFESHNKRKLK